MNLPDARLHFRRPAIVLKQPLLVAVTVAFTLAVTLAGLWPEEGPAETEPLPWWAWLFWLAVLAALALGVWMLCHAEEIVFEGATQRVTQTHRFLHHVVKTNHWRFADFTGVAVTLKIDRHEEGSATPTGTATLGNRRVTHQRRYELSLGRPDAVLKTPERTLTAPRPALDIPLPDERDVLVVEAVARRLAAMGAWPAERRHYTLLPSAAVQVAVGTREALT